MISDKKEKKKIIKTPFEKWFDETKENGFNKASIVMHDNPDPDAIASAFAIYHLLQKVEIEAEIFWSGQMNHTQNKKFINVTGITDVMTKLNGEINERVVERFKNYPIIIVDTSCKPGEGNLRNLSKFLPEDKKIDLVIDHHDEQTVDPKYYHYESYGACSSIIYEILSRLKQTSRLDPVLATALYFAIEKDTIKLKHESTTEKDIEYHKKLRPKIDEGLYDELVNYTFPLDMLDIERKCYKFMDVYSGMIVCGAGFILAEKESYLASIADELFRKYDNIDFVCVLGISYSADRLNSERLVVSVRKTGSVIDTDEFMKMSFGEGFGGRKGMGGGSCGLSDDLLYAIDAAEENNEKEELFRILFDGWKKKVASTRIKMS